MPDKVDSLEKLYSSIIQCTRCPRLVQFRNTVLSDSKKYSGEKFWRKPVTGFGDPDARMIVVGLAPAASGANRTGRVFTGDKSSEVLVSAFHSIGVSNLSNSISRDDGLVYTDLYLTLAVRCVPPDNRPTNDEVNNCKVFLASELAILARKKAIVALGSIALDSLKKSLSELGYQVNGMKFQHGRFFDLGDIRVYCCYHPSPRNINTGRTSVEDIARVLKSAYDFASL